MSTEDYLNNAPESDFVGKRREEHIAKLRMEECIAGAPLELYQKIRAILIHCNHFDDEALTYDEAVVKIRELVEQKEQERLAQAGDDQQYLFHLEAVRALEGKHYWLRVKFIRPTLHGDEIHAQTDSGKNIYPLRSDLVPTEAAVSVASYASALKKMESEIRNLVLVFKLTKEDLAERNGAEKMREAILNRLSVGGIALPECLYKSQHNLGFRCPSCGVIELDRICKICGKQESQHQPSAGVNRITAHQFFPKEIDMNDNPNKIVAGTGKPKPSVGRIVHFVVKSGRHLPAIITDVFEVQETVNICVFWDIKAAGVAAAGLGLTDGWAEVKQDENSKEPGTWHWPEIV